jgi:hypothetical protein
MNTIVSVEENLSELHRLITVLSDPNFLYLLRKHEVAYKAVIEHYARFKVGERIQLVRAPDFSKAPGWQGSQHFLIAGARGTVMESDISVNSGKLRYNFEFDSESWRDAQGIIHPIAVRHMYSFGEDMLEPEVVPGCVFEWTDE